MNNYLIDTHCHIDMKDFESDFDLIISNANDANVRKIVVPSVDRNSFDRVIGLCEQYENLYAAVAFTLLRLKTVWLMISRLWMNWHKTKELWQ